MKKKLVFTTLLSCLFLVGCGSSSVSQEKAIETIKKAAEKDAPGYTSGVRTSKVTKCDVSYKNVPDEIKEYYTDEIAESAKANLLAGMGVSKVGEEIKTDISADQIDMFRISVSDFEDEFTSSSTSEQEGAKVSYYVSGDKVTVKIETASEVTSGDTGTSVTMKMEECFDEYAYISSYSVSSTTITTVKDSSFTLTIALDYEVTCTYSK